MRQHHSLSASALGILAVSPAFEPDETQEKIAAERGTLLHRLVETREHPEGLSGEEEAALAFALAHVDAVERRVQGQGQIYREVYLAVDNELVPQSPLPGSSGGFVDWLWIGEDAAHLIDFKFGVRPVPEASVNLQGKVYTLGVFHRFPQVQRVKVEFVMARHEQVSCHEFLREEVPRLLTEVRTVVARALVARRDKALDKCAASVATCPYCAFRAHCPVLWSFVADVGKAAQVSVPDIQKALREFDPDAAGATLDAIQLLRTWADSVRNTLTQHAVDSESGWLPTGYRLRSRENTEIDAPLFAQVCQQNNIPQDVLLRAVTFKLTPVLAHVAETAPRGGKQAAQEHFRAALKRAGALLEKEPVVFLERVR